MDNNILACRYGIEQLRELTETNFKVDLNQGMDIRKLDKETCQIISKVKWLKYIRFSCDTAAQLPYFEKAVKLFDEFRVPKSKIFVYFLVRNDLEEANARLQKLHSICKSFSVYAQAERNESLGIRPTKLQLEFAQRYVYGRLYKKETWPDYCKRINIKL